MLGFVVSGRRGRGWCYVAQVVLMRWGRARRGGKVLRTGGAVSRRRPRGRSKVIAAVLSSVGRGRSGRRREIVTRPVRGNRGSLRGSLAGRRTGGRGIVITVSLARRRTRRGSIILTARARRGPVRQRRARRCGIVLARGLLKLRLLLLRVVLWRHTRYLVLWRLLLLVLCRPRRLAVAGVFLAAETHVSFDWAVVLCRTKGRFGGRGKARTPFVTILYYKCSSCCGSNQR
ncbi:hypothetical protein VTG60DRAFT_1229 [Thermothelomyces hinnuleus]